MKTILTSSLLILIISASFGIYYLTHAEQILDKMPEKNVLKSEKDLDSSLINLELSINYLARNHECYQMAGEYKLKYYYTGKLKYKKLYYLYVDSTNYWNNKLQRTPKSK